jgi:transposase InsO family protein
MSAAHARDARLRACRVGHQGGQEHLQGLLVMPRVRSAKFQTWGEAFCEIGARGRAIRALARRQVFPWITAYCNRARLHSTIGYETPARAQGRYGQPAGLVA